MNYLIRPRALELPLLIGATVNNTVVKQAIGQNRNNESSVVCQSKMLNLKEHNSSHFHT
jgi:hypothetical protein